jgi:hypothetical protein
MAAGAGVVAGGRGRPPLPPCLPVRSARRSPTNLGTTLRDAHIIIRSTRYIFGLWVERKTEKPVSLQGPPKPPPNQRPPFSTFRLVWVGFCVNVSLDDVFSRSQPSAPSPAVAVQIERRNGFGGDPFHGFFDP